MVSVRHKQAHSLKTGAACHALVVDTEYLQICRTDVSWAKVSLKAGSYIIVPSCGSLENRDSVPFTISIYSGERLEIAEIGKRQSIVWRW